MFIDSHCHFDIILENSKLTPGSVLTGMSENNVGQAVQVSINCEGMEWSYDFARENRKNGILFSLGIHPSSKAGKEDLEYLSSFVEKVMNSGDSELLFGIGECGLDFYRMRQPEEMQENSFRFQVELAKKHDLPLIVHSRDAMDKTVRLLRETAPERGIMHCFPGDEKEAEKVLDLGFTISFAGNVTYKNAAELHRSASYVPADRMIIETDAPFLTPVPFRGKKNLPHYIVNTYRFIADLKKEPLSTIEDKVYENFMRLKKH